MKRLAVPAAPSSFLCCYSSRYVEDCTIMIQEIGVVPACQIDQDSESPCTLEASEVSSIIP